LCSDSAHPTLTLSLSLHQPRTLTHLTGAPSLQVTADEEDPFPLLSSSLHSSVNSTDMDLRERRDSVSCELTKGSYSAVLTPTTSANTSAGNSSRGVPKRPAVG
jgi:ferric-dicitrate binding protein FerR (iron transport regulator)